MLASQRNQLEIVNELCKHGADINLQNKWGDTALIYAAANTNRPIIQQLLKYNPQIDLQNVNGYTALMLAAEKNDTGCVHELLAAGADIDIGNGWNTAVLTFAAQNGNLDMINLLISYGKLTDTDTVNSANIEGKTALMLAANTTYPAVIEALLENGAMVNVQNKFGDTAMHWPALLVIE